MWTAVAIARTKSGSRWCVNMTVEPEKMSPIPKTMPADGFDCPYIVYADAVVQGMYYACKRFPHGTFVRFARRYPDGHWEYDELYIEVAIPCEGTPDAKVEHFSAYHEIFDKYPVLLPLLTAHPF